MNQFPQITIVTPSFNSASTIERTLKSVERQRYPNLQYVCVDGNSGDETLSILDRYKHIIETIISEPDKNASDAINKGFRLATGEIYCYINADDELADDALFAVAAFFTNNPEVDVVTGACRRIFEDHSETITQVHQSYWNEMALRNLIEQPSTFWRASLHKQAGEFDTSYYYAFDWEMWNRFKSNHARFMMVNQVLSIYHFTDNNLTSRAGKKVIDEMFRITRKYGPYKGSIAYAYLLLFYAFDLHGFYDFGVEQLHPLKKYTFKFVHFLLERMFEKIHLKAYNWNWASKQIRGLVWYK
jgi:glycosyltransferase involved in cell wall biosynthesis